MIPKEVRLFTWVDVEEVLLRAQQENHWPEWLAWARAYWDGLTLGIRPGKKNEALEWLSQKFEPRFNTTAEGVSILLESIVDKPRQLKVLFEETTDEALPPRLTPSLARPAVLSPPYEHEHPTSLPHDLPPVVAFHSFKGGVGRTIHALALARALAERERQSRVLLVDGDLEAPGLTWLLRARLPDPPVSFVDFLALVHGDPNPSAEDSIELVADRVRDAMLEGIYVLPAFRSVAQFTSLEIRPEHLIQGAEDPFIVTSALARLGNLLNARAVIVDLRAGFSELSAGLLLDSRVYRVLVTTLSGQSIEGTCELLELLGKSAPSKREEEPLPALIFSQVPDEHQKEDQLGQFEEQLIKAAKRFWENEQEDGTLGIPRLVGPFDPRLTVLPVSWDKVMNRLDQAGLVEQMSPLIDWLPGIRLADANARGLKLNVKELKRQRLQLAQFAEKLYTKSGDAEEFLAISSLRNLASDFSAKAPIGIIIGTYGSGKTYTFMQIARRQAWQKFVRDAGIMEVAIEAYVYPLFRSGKLDETAKSIVKQARRETATKLGFSHSPARQNILLYLNDSLKKDLNESQWRERWLNIIAWSVGFKPEQDDAGRKFADYLRERKQFVVVVIDGLEELFQAPSSQKQWQTALRSLLQEVPDWLEQQPSRPIGLLVFIRQDMVLHAMRHNAAQLMARYKPYALKWDSEEALRLAAWTAIKAGVSTDLAISNLQWQNKVDLISALVLLWGNKLGQEHSKRARSADWIMAALSDLKEQIQPRDLVRFLHKAAQNSETDWKDRLLIPAAIRSATKICSAKKIEEIGAENETVRHIFLKLQDLPDHSKQLPFTREQVNLSVEEIKMLEDNDVILRDGEEYDMAELHRLGLGFKLKAGARLRVLGFSHRSPK
jgi:MinD-like ATPase involved in chromosome partitioning or flagellar assembly